MVVAIKLLHGVRMEKAVDLRAIAGVCTDSVCRARPIYSCSDGSHRVDLKIVPIVGMFIVRSVVMGDRICGGGAGYTGYVQIRPKQY